MDPNLQIALNAARTAALPVIQSLANSLHDEVDKLISLHNEAEVAAPFLEKARAGLSDVVGALGSHATLSPSKSQSEVTNAGQ